MKSKEPKIVYYDDPLNDEFSGFGERRKMKIDGDYPYVRKNLFYKIAAFVVYRVFVTPAAFMYGFFKFRVKFVGREKLKPYKKTGYFMYGNHTQTPGDAFIPNMMTFPKSTYFVVNPDNVAAPGTKNLMMMLGAIPTPTELSGFRAFESAIKRRIDENSCIVIYPEAHIWPYYTGIRPFRDVSFGYPAKLDKPAFCFTVTYRESKRGKPRMVVYIDGPLESDAQNARKKATELRDMAYETMCRRASECNNHPFVIYKKREEAKS